jgi:hypothetical protein
MQNHNTSAEEPNTTNTNCGEAANLQEFKTYSSSFPLGSFRLCFRKHLSIMAYCTIGHSNFLHQFRAATPPEQRKLELKACNLDVSNFRH